MDEVCVWCGGDVSHEPDCPKIAMDSMQSHIEDLESKLDEYEHRAKLHMDQCRHDMERIVRLEQQLETRETELADLKQEAARLSKDCKHCDHLTARWEDTAGEHKRWQCCHCGRVRDEYAPSAVWETGGHGPFLPRALLDEIERLRNERERVERDLIEMRIGNATPCEPCHGLGVRTYGSTATWRGGVGGQAITSDVCDRCWGSGNADRPWPSHRHLLRERQ